MITPSELLIHPGYLKNFTQTLISRMSNLELFSQEKAKKEQNLKPHTKILISDFANKSIKSCLQNIFMLLF